MNKLTSLNGTEFKREVASQIIDTHNFMRNNGGTVTMVKEALRIQFTMQGLAQEWIDKVVEVYHREGVKGGHIIIEKK